ncbi:MAG: bifunctional 5,10-methylene-tetrahydrofolate dehydrogenase/5,10-methylene-tetrahydrofolate cyclohydrolase [Actinobacteria bacterium]|nr:bifunctional 5,10-methylene-tetrahydrofolate dehydrogenase/5,10-methylene-tetrahydrofolate cyclohydrolase [Actinomycetota bacterium]
MRAAVIDGNAFAAELKSRLAEEVRLLSTTSVRPGLATVIAGDDYAAQAYERRVRHLAHDLGCNYVCERLGSNVEQADALAVVGKLNADPRISGILILRPLVASVSEAEIYRALDPLKDIEAVHPLNAGLLALGRPRYIPSTPASCFYLLDRYLRDSGRDPRSFYRGITLVLVGRSNNVGKPALWLGLARNATVISCDRYTFEAGRLPEHTRRADVLVVAAGAPSLIGSTDVSEGVIAIDVGINPIVDPDSGARSFVGDLDFEGVATKAEAISPVPGGVGPITDIWLLHNTVSAARLAAGIARVQPSLEGLGLE